MENLWGIKLPENIKKLKKNTKNLIRKLDSKGPRKNPISL